MPERAQPSASFSAGRRWLIGLNMSLKVAAFLTVVVVVNYLAAGHYRRWQWAGDSMYRLSGASRAVLGGLTNEVTVTLFFDPEGANEEIYDMTAALLKEYQGACPLHLRVRKLDYSRNDAEARRLLNEHRLSGLKEKDFVLVEARGRDEIIYARDLADYDFSGVLSGKGYVRRSGFRGEVAITGAIYAVSYGEPQKAYFLEGHGERDPGKAGAAPQNDGLGVTQLASILENELNCQWGRLSLTGTNEIPADCQLLIIAGPSLAPLEAGEIQKINAYLNKGGRLLALAPSESDVAPGFHSHLAALLEPWNVGLGDSFVVDTDKKFQIGQYEFLTAKMTQHAITGPLADQGIGVQMAAPRPVFQLVDKTGTPGAPQVTLLAQTSADGMWGPQKGSWGLLAAVEKGDIPGVNGPKCRIVVAGAVDFLDDRNINTAANHYFAGLAMNWLLNRPQLAVAGVQSHPIREHHIFLTEAQSTAMHWLFLAGMPGAALGLGGLVWLRRRS